MTFTLEQFLPSCHLRVIPILDLEPRRSLVFRDVVPKAVLRNDALQIHLADPLEQRRPVLLDVFDVPHSGFRDLGHQTPQFVFPVCQSFRP